MARYEALGLIETFGLVFALEAADAMCKAAEVELVGYENVASGYISVLVQGDVGACKAAVDAGVAAVNAMEDANLYSYVVIPRPHQDLQKIIKRYAIEGLLPEQK
ncbi:BMC domain-containing protein [Clostridium fermenticellae]|uniref:BMC domain-containing protein n=1 Tax=Clostridium fermenticellae TaxID=2068654 RepID=A0A386H4D2_9CLOT|nr:BMC domain-containing protein [Clostridium fermenticellae]AYD40418.1 BMC domain-containing protein [Clostridium fermenticellae]